MRRFRSPEPRDREYDSADSAHRADSDNLTLEDQLQLPENLAGKSLISSDHNTMYSISDSGVMILPVGNLNQYPRLSASVEDLVFRGNFCDRNVTTQTFTITDPGGGHTPFSISTTTSGITDFAVQRRHPGDGTRYRSIPTRSPARRAPLRRSSTSRSSAAVNLPPAVRVLINSQRPVAARDRLSMFPARWWTCWPIPSASSITCCARTRTRCWYSTRANNTQKATLRTCTTPTRHGHHLRSAGSSGRLRQLAYHERVRSGSAHAASA